MPKVNIINCKTKDLIIIYSFAPVMVSESTTTSDISVFEKLKINQLSLSKENLRFGKHRII